MVTAGPGSVDLYWLPLGAGGRAGVVRWSGRAYEALVAHRQHRPRQDLYHSALEVRVGDERRVVEMTPVWGLPPADRGVVLEGPVGARLLGRSRLFRYEVHAWRDGVIPDVAQAVGGARTVSRDGRRAQRVLDLVGRFPARTWGRDELATGDMWNSNSLTAWLLARTGHDVQHLAPPSGGRAPGWDAGLVAAGRDDAPTAPLPRVRS